MFGKTKDVVLPDELRSPAPVQQLQRFPAATPVAEPPASNEISSISAGMTLTGKITGSGTVKILGRVQGELQASTVLVAEGAEVEGDVVAEDLTVGGRVKGTIRANRVRLNSTANVEGDIFHRSLAIEENARFEGSSRRDDNIADTSRVIRSQAGSHVGVDSARKRNGAPEKEVEPSPAIA